MMESSKLNRREVLNAGASGLLGAGLCPRALRAEDAPGEFSFLAVNDLHYLDDRCGKWLEGAIRQMKAHPEKPEFCLISGDLVESGTAAQLGPVRDLLDTLGMPFYVVMGNHDYLAQDDRKAYEQLFPNRINYQFEHRGWQFIGLDTSEGLKYQNTSVQAPTLRFLEVSLPKLNKKRPTVVFTHFPLGPAVPMRPLNAEAVLAAFKDHNLQAVFSGHFHGFTERTVGATTLTTDRCCSFSRANHDLTKEKGYFLCRAREGKISRTFVEVKPA
jgi:3',5'-cyclic AMP phosphodiesterase CpdA